MYMAPKINAKLKRLRPTLTGSVPLEIVLSEVETALKPFGVRVIIDHDDSLARPDFCCSGSYDYTRRKQPIEVIMHFNRGIRTYKFTKKAWSEFSFLLSQVVQHELIHKHQFSHREGLEHDMCLYYDIKAGEKSDKEYMDYLAELDEIDAYAHDIALEIRQYYPNLDPYQVLSTINQRRKLWSWNHYSDAFAGVEDWSDVKNRLLKKTYLWLPHVTV